MTDSPSIIGILLAGGASRRMGGGYKCLRTLGDTTLLQCCAERAKPQVAQLLLNLSCDHSDFDKDLIRELSLPVVADILPDFAGPLAGILAGMEWVKQHQPEVQWLASFASDTPYFPSRLIETLYLAAQEQQRPIAFARSHAQTHPVFALWHLSLLDDLRSALLDEDIHGVQYWAKRHQPVHVDFTDNPQGHDPFFNINCPDDLVKAELMLNGMSPV